MFTLLILCMGVNAQNVIPTTSILNIKMNSNLKRATIYSILGSKILETTSNNIEVSNFKSGIYLLKIEDENGSISTKRFMKEE